MKKQDIDDVIIALRSTGMSKEFCEEIRKNADSGALDYALDLIQGEDNCVGHVQCQSFRQTYRRLRY